jgi:hypothetical protein
VALEHPRGGVPGCDLPPPPNEIKKTDFVDIIISKILRDLHFSLNQPLKSADDWYIGILKNIIKTYEYVDFFFFS